MKVNVGEILTRRAARTPDGEAVVDVATGRRFTFAQFNDRANRSADLLRRLGVATGDRVAVLAKNGPEFMETFFGCAKAGMVVVPLNWRLVPDELEFILADSGAVALVFDDDFAGVVEDLHGRGDRTALRHWVQLGPRPCAPFARRYEELAGAASGAEPRIEAEGDDLLHIMYTSGTTGLPKGAVHTQASGYWASVNSALTFDLREGDRFQVCLPMFHIGALFPCQTCVHIGATSVIMREFDPKVAWEVIEHEHITGTLLVPAMLTFMLGLYEGLRPRHELLRWAWSGAAPVPVTSIQAYTDLGIPIWQLYGLTESYGVGTACTATQSIERPGTAGKGYYLSDVRVVDGDMVDLEPGTQGEILLRGPHMMAGYWQRPEASAEVQWVDPADGTTWLRTGDAGVLDADGFVFVQDRIKDMLISGGENVYPAELENVILGHPQVKEVAVIGIPSAKWGESPLAVIVPADDGLTEADVLAFCEGRLARFKLPKAVRFVAEIPRNPSGKVLKRVLRDEFPLESPE
jgi:acyl-CoA synthetase (AMP-forming)/AMP-acid ligase II